MSAYFAFFLARFAGGAAWSGVAFSSLAADAFFGASLADEAFGAGAFFGVACFLAPAVLVAAADLAGYAQPGSSRRRGGTGSAHACR